MNIIPEGFLSNANDGDWLQSMVALLGIVLSPILLLILYFVERKVDRKDHFIERKKDRKDELHYRLANIKFDESKELDAKLIKFYPYLKNLSNEVSNLNSNGLNMIHDGELGFNLYSNSENEIKSISQKIIDLSEQAKPEIREIQDSLETFSLDDGNLKYFIDQIKVVIDTTYATTLEITNSFSQYSKNSNKRDDSIDKGFKKLSTRISSTLTNYKNARKEIRTLQEELMK